MKNNQICLIGIKHCEATLKAKVWLDLQELSYEYVDITHFTQSLNHLDYKTPMNNEKLSDILHFLHENTHKIFKVTDVDVKNIQDEIDILLHKKNSALQLPMVLFYSDDRLSAKTKISSLIGFEANTYFDAVISHNHRELC